MNPGPRGLPASEVLNIWTKIVCRVVDYGFGVEYGRLEPPRKGIFDGLKLTIEPSVDLEMQCFLLLHLFGHSVQWVAPSYRPEILGLDLDPLDDFLVALRAYEGNAARFGLQVLHEAGITHLDAWFADFAETDWKYVERYYREGAIPAWEDCIVRNARPIQPLAVPPLEPRLVDKRFAF
ncbi:hypothetical protein OJF2_56730 [Aquisphaera giovannonii]|uniref:Uncharacterized protein n=1 Tax=Aquisphaera giovannonii TaxID=406548 RepID=A0A5B9W909_9BACT|nr:hypothetical protein [Aquisphaera giovannonii]QEH37088.1 hypothetical protein OJF2_56730 [Aquisphaera giovannonii]